MNRLTFYGAASEVTGSKHLIEVQGRKILLDCGLWQGGHDDHQPQRLPFDPASIDAVIISHAHLDHVGMLPLLLRQGYQGLIWSTGATKDLTELILLDAAKIQEQDAEYHRRHQPNQPFEPLYTPADIPAVMERFRHLTYAHLGGIMFPILPEIKVKLYDAGHILGSAVVVLEYGEENKVERLVYTGDLGRQNAPLLRDPDVPTESAKTLIMESTYGTRQHHPIASVEDRLVAAMQEAVQRRSKIIIPAFSLGRTQELIYLLHQLTDRGRLPRIPIVIDSPLATKITAVFNQHQQDYDREVAQDFTRPQENPLTFSNLEFTESVDESKALNSRGGPLMIIAASGMASGGRVLHHLRNSLAIAENMIIFTGYQARGTLGQKIVNGEPQVRLFGENIPVRAKIMIFNDLSAHADGSELTTFAEGITDLQAVYLVHGESERAAGLQQHLQERHPGWVVTIPTKNQTVNLP